MPRPELDSGCETAPCLHPACQPLERQSILGPSVFTGAIRAIEHLRPVGAKKSSIRKCQVSLKHTPGHCLDSGLSEHGMHA